MGFCRWTAPPRTAGANRARGRFFAPDELVVYLGEHGVRGSCFATSRVSYAFIGTVDKQRALSG